MARKFPDTSALIKLYRNEPNSPEVRACFAPNDALLIAQITPLEFPSAFYGLVRQKLLTEAEAGQYIAGFRADISRYEIVSADQVVYAEALRLLDKYASQRSLRPPDALQLASALVEHLRVPLGAFVTTDKVLRDCAIGEGLTVLP